jgi:hypothetical protein
MLVTTHSNNGAHEVYNNNHGSLLQSNELTQRRSTLCPNLNQTGNELETFTQWERF